MSQKLVKFCDGCGRSQEQKGRDVFYNLVFEGDFYESNPCGEMGCKLLKEHLCFCASCTKKIKESLEKVVDKIYNNTVIEFLTKILESELDETATAINLDKINIENNMWRAGWVVGRKETIDYLLDFVKGLDLKRKI